MDWKKEVKRARETRDEMILKSFLEDPRITDKTHINMGTQSLWQKFKGFVSSIGFKMFLWGIEMTQDEYLNDIYEQEKLYREN